jgi:hypothetical protein
MPRPERCCRCVETRRYATARSIDHTAYHRLPRGRSDVQSNDAAVSVSQSNVQLGSVLNLGPAGPLPQVSNGRKPQAKLGCLMPQRGFGSLEHHRRTMNRAAPRNMLAEAFAVSV